jgi:hypothetical protein
MTTITFDENIKTSKTHYRNINELIEELQNSAFLNIEVEPLNMSNFSDEFQIKTQEYTQELKTLLAKRK